MSAKKETAVTWLINQFKKFQSQGEKMSWNEIIQIAEIAKEPEREHIEQAYGDGLNAHRTNFCNRIEYFEQTFEINKK